MRSVYKIITKESEVDTLIKYVLETGYCSFDFETTSLCYYEDSEYPTILSIAFQVGSGWVIPLGHFDSPFRDNFVEILTRFCKATICNPNIVKIAWNAKYEYKWLRKYGITPIGRFFDSMLAKYPLDEERPHGLKPNVAKLLPDFAGYDLPGSGGKNFNWARVPLEQLSMYGAKDADFSLRLFLFYESRLMDRGFYPLYRNMFCMLVRVMGKMEFEGMPIDVPYLDTTIKKYKNLILENEQAIRDSPKVRRYQKYRDKERKESYLQKLQDDLDEAEDNNTRAVASIKARIRNVTLGIYSNKTERNLAEPINFGSPDQMADLLYDSPKGFRYDCVEFTDKGKPSTAEETLLKLKADTESPFIDTLLKYRELQKLDSTYISGMRSRVSSHNKVHCNYKINGTVTGRLCISDKGLIETDMGKICIRDLCPQTEGVRPIMGVYALTHMGRYKPITLGINKGEEEMFEVILDNGNSIECTLGHRFLTDKGWVPLLDILNNTTEYLIKT